MSFFDALQQFAFLQHALIGGLLAALACGLVGPYVVSKRISYIAGGIAHTVLGGMGVFHYLGWPPIWGALLTALCAAWVMSYVATHYRSMEDALISALWSSGMAVGVIFMAMSPGYNVDLMTYLFGNILLIGSADLILSAIVVVIIGATIFVFRKLLLAVSFDEEFAAVRGVSVGWLNFLLYSLVALTTVVMIQIVGLVLVIALVTMPAMIARRLTHSMVLMMLYASAIGAALTWLGLAMSYELDVPSGATIVLLTAAVFALSLWPRRKGVRRA